MDTDQPIQERRPTPTYDDVLDGAPGAQSGYMQQIYIDAVQNYGHYNIERVRVMRRPFGGGDSPLTTLTQRLGHLLSSAPVKATGIFGDFEFSPGQNSTITHSYMDLVLRHPETGERKMLRIEKGPVLKADEVGGWAAGVGYHDKQEQARVAAINMLPGLNFREFSKKALEEHAASHSGDATAVGRYRIANQNCQDFSLAALRGSGLLTDDLNDFVKEYNTPNLPGWLQTLINDRAMKVRH